MPTATATCWWAAFSGGVRLPGAPDADRAAAAPPSLRQRLRGRFTRGPPDARRFRAAARRTTVRAVTLDRRPSARTIMLRLSSVTLAASLLFVAPGSAQGLQGGDFVVIDYGTNTVHRMTAAG